MRSERMVNMFNIDAQTLIIIALLVFIFGLMVGFSFGRPRL
jgi:hypothetical protein